MTGLLGLGLLVLAIVTWDLLIVTIGGGTRLSVSTRIAAGTFAGLRVLSRVVGARVLTEVSGVVVMLSVAAFWILGFWLGWALVLGGGGSVAMAGGTQVAEAADIVGHAGHLLSTLGGAVTEPRGPGWNIVNALVGLNGMLALTLSVSFLLAVRATLEDGRAFAMLAATGQADPEALTDRLADVLAGLHASPFALWYGHPRSDRRVPDALLAHARQAEAAGDPVAPRTRALLRDLPHWEERDGEPFLDAMLRWTRAHQLHDVGR